MDGQQASVGVKRDHIQCVGEDAVGSQPSLFGSAAGPLGAGQGVDAPTCATLRCEAMGQLRKMGFAFELEHGRASSLSAASTFHAAAVTAARAWSDHVDLRRQDTTGRRPRNASRRVDLAVEAAIKAAQTLDQLAKVPRLARAVVAWAT